MYLLINFKKKKKMDNFRKYIYLVFIGKYWYIKNYSMQCCFLKGGLEIKGGGGFF